MRAGLTMAGSGEVAGADAASKRAFTPNSRACVFPVGVGGAARVEHAVEFLMAGASAIQVGTATFADPRASTLVVRGLAKWCGRNNISSIAQLIGAAHDR